jgi:hypothetical protein
MSSSLRVTVDSRLVEGCRSVSESDMQKRGTGRSRGESDAQRQGSVAQRESPTRELERGAEVRVRGGTPALSLAGHADGGLTLAALYDTGAFERMRLEVRVRLIADVAQSLSWLHSNPRLMEAQPYLNLMPSTVVIGLDGVARIDLRAAKKQDRDAAYAAPEALKGDGSADRRADLYSLGIVTWEALTGERLGLKWPAPSEARVRRPRRVPEGRPEPVVLGGAMVARRRDSFNVSTPVEDELRSGPGGAKPQRMRAAPFPSLPPDADWARPLGEMAVKALSPDPRQRPRDASVMLEQFESIAEAHLATHHEIAEVVQGISNVSSLYTPEPGPPRADQRCQPATTRRTESRRAPLSCNDDTVITCVQPEAAFLSLQPPAPAALPVAAPKIIMAERVTPVAQGPAAALQRMTAAYPRGVWIGVGLLWILTFGLLVGYFASRTMIPQ